MLVNLDLSKSNYLQRNQGLRKVSFSNSVSFSADTYNDFLKKKVNELSKTKSAPLVPSQTQPVVVPEAKPVLTTQDNSILLNRNITFAAIGVSLIALGAALYSASGRSKLAKSMASFGNNIAEQGKKIDIIAGDVTNIKGKGDVAEKIASQAAETIRGIAGVIKSKSDFITSNVEVNGRHFNFATMINPINLDSPAGRSFVAELQSQSARNILGLTNPLPARSGQPMVRVVASELKPFTSVGGLASVPKEIAEELPKILTKDSNARIVLDTPLYTGKIAVKNGKEIYGSLENIGGTQDFTYVLGNNKYKLNLIDTFKTKILGGQEETVRIFQHQVLGDAIPVEKVIGELSPEYAARVQNLAKGAKIETQNFIIKNVEGQKTFQRKVTYNLWDNGKFNLDTPLSSSPDIYSRNNFSSGLEERQILFDKYIYEHMLKLEEQNGGMLLAKDGSTLLRTDGLILNDWHTGPLAAMLRLDSTARKYHGAIRSETADRLRNMSIISLIHNNKYDGGNYSPAEVERLLNMMFGQYTAQIVPNAYVINAYNEAAKAGGVNSELLNALMKNEGICPLNMLANYSNSLHPVSSGYARELITMPELGQGFESIYRIRAKLNNNLEPLSSDVLQQIARTNGIEISNSDLAKLQASTYYGINNGLNKQKNILNNATIQQLQEVLTKDLTKAESDALVSKYGSSFRSILPETAIDFSSPQEVLKWKMHNKKAVLGYYIDSINEAKRAYAADNSKFAGRLNTWAADMTDLTGVTENTPIFVTAGRIDSQKGYETYLNAIVEYVKAAAQRGEKDFPVFQLQGGVDLANSYAKSVLDHVIATKKALIAAGYEQAAKRIVFLDNGAGGKYAISKLVADFNCMASTFEPCGLTHKEFLNMSGAVPIGHDTGGITAGLKDGVTGIFTAYRDTSKMEEKAANLAKVFERAVDTFRAKDKYASMVAAAKPLDFTWIQKGNPDCSGQKYLEAMRNAGMVLDNVTA